MKDYKSFIKEVTERDLRGMGANDKQIATLKKRSAQRGNTGYGVKGSTGDHFDQKSPTTAQNQNKQNKKPGLGGGALAVNKGKDGNSASGASPGNKNTSTATPASGASQDNQNTSTATSRRARRAEVRQNKIDKIKYDRGQNLKQGVKAASWIRDRVVGKGSGTIGTTSGGNSSDPSVRYQ